MANQFLTPQVIAYEALRILRSNILFADLVHKDFSSEFAAKVGDTVNVRKRNLIKSKEFQSEIEIQDKNESDNFAKFVAENRNRYKNKLFRSFKNSFKTRP